LTLIHDVAKEKQTGDYAPMFREGSLFVSCVGPARDNAVEQRRVVMPTSAKPARKSAAGLRVIAMPKGAPSGATKKPTATIGKKLAASRTARSSGGAISDQQRRNYVEVAAYYLAERRGFAGGSEIEDWAQAEREVDRLLREHRLSS
jgi:DUF2934 family protein